MTLIIEIPIEKERQLRSIADARGETLESLALIQLNSLLTGATLSNADEEREAARLAAIDAGFGMFAGRGQSVDDFLADRHAEGEADFDRWQGSQTQREAERSGT